MKLKNILLCASVLGGLALSSCTGNFLDEDRNPNSLDPENFWKSESDILKGLTAAYAGLQPTIEWAQPFERYIVIDNYRSDELDYRPDVTAWMELAMYNNESTNYVPNSIPVSTIATSVWTTFPMCPTTMTKASSRPKRPVLPRHVF